MNTETNNDHHEPDYEAAHFVAYHKMPKEDLQLGILNCTDYLIEYHKELGETPPPVTRDLLHALDTLPKLGRDSVEAQLVAEAFNRSHLDIPSGLHDLPANWGFAIRRIIMETHWPELPSCQIRDVFGWTDIERFGAHLHIQFDQTLDNTSAPWCDIGNLIHQLHLGFEPGPYTPLGRLCEFIV